MSFNGFPHETIQFYADLADNNDKSWFDAHRGDYEAYALEPARGFVVAMGEQLRKLAPNIMADPRINKSIFRIYRDTRFSKDKTPYKTHLAIWFPIRQNGAKFDFPGYYFHLEPGNLMLGAGIHGFSKPLLKAYRDAVVDPEQGPALVQAMKAVTGKGYNIGEKTYKRVPRGYDPGHELAELLLYSGLTTGKDLGMPDEIRRASLVEYCFERYRDMAPLVNWLDNITAGG